MSIYQWKRRWEIASLRKSCWGRRMKMVSLKPFQQFREPLSVKTNVCMSSCNKLVPLQMECWYVSKCVLSLKEVIDGSESSLNINVLSKCFVVSINTWIARGEVTDASWSSSFCKEISKPLTFLLPFFFTMCVLWKLPECFDWECSQWFWFAFQQVTPHLYLNVS